MKLLRETIRRLILEGLNFGKMGNLALYKGRFRGDALYVLFDIALIDELKELTGLKDKKYSERKIVGQSKNIYAMLKVDHDRHWSGDCNAASMVSLARAKDGWGPTMYDIVMGLYPDGLMADRDSVSEDAFPVWDYYYKNRSQPEMIGGRQFPGSEGGDIEKIPLDHHEYKWTKGEDDDCAPGSDGDYLGDTGWREYYSDEREDFLEDPLSWSYNRGPVPNTDQLWKNWDLFDAMADELDFSLTPEFWIDVSMAFLSLIHI